MNRYQARKRLKVLTIAIETCAMRLRETDVLFYRCPLCVRFEHDCSQCPVGKRKKKNVTLHCKDYRLLITQLQLRIHEQLKAFMDEKSVLLSDCQQKYGGLP